MRTFAVTFEVCGWGASWGLFPEVRLGRVRFWMCRGSIINQVSHLRCALAEAAAELRKSGRRT